ncbi:MAG: HEAT repeat domain-containing protein [Candidatus Wallbacteria bacterium]|nr:HEAT repeat domain-containing protein [Candidatus Wallbacteria bacterium]
MTEIELEPIVALLDSADERLRLQGARRLAGVGTPEAVQLLRARGLSDTSPAVRHFVRKALRVLDIDPSDEGADTAQPPAARAPGGNPTGALVGLGQSGLTTAPTQSRPTGGLSLPELEGTAPEGPLDPPDTPALTIKEAERLQRAAASILRPCVQLLIENLEHQDVSVAGESATALGKLRAREATDRLIDILRAGSSDESVPLALGEMGDPKALASLIRIFREDPRPNFKQAIVTAVAKIRAPAAEDFLRSALESPDPALQTAVVRVMGETQNPAWAEFLLDRIGKMDEYLEMTMIHALGRLAPGHPRVIVRFSAILKTEANPRKLASLVMALARTRDARLVDTLEPFTAHRDRRVRANAVEAVSALDAGAPVKLRILRPLLTDPDNRVRANACISLGRLGDRRALDTLVTMLGDANKWHRASACYAIGVLRPPDGAGFLIKGLRDLDPAVRVNAAKALRELADPAAAQTLISAINDRNLWVRLYAIESLGNMQVKSANPRLRACIKQEANHQVVATALLAVARTGSGDESTRIVVDFLKHDDSRVRANAIEALEYIFTRQSVSHIASCLRDPDHRVRANAVKAIWKFGELRVVTTLHGMLSSARPEERRSGAYALGEIGAVMAGILTLANSGRLVKSLQEHSAYAAAAASASVQ